MSTLDPQLALRIGLAARALALPPADFVPRLLAVLKRPLTDQKLEGLTLDQLSRALQDRRCARDALIDALGYLHDRMGVDIIDSSIPAPTHYAEGDMPGSIRVAVASDRGLMVDGDFGTCERFLVYQVSRHETRLIEVRGTAGEKGAAKRLAWRAERIADCHLLLARSVTTRASAPLVHQNCYPVTYLQPVPAPDAIDELRRLLRKSPPPWLAKLVRPETCVAAPAGLAAETHSLTPSCA